MKVRFITDDGTTTGNVVGVLDRYQRGAVSGRDCASFDVAVALAASATSFDGARVFIATDGGEYVSPRYGTMEAPRVGEPVSYAFNGDYYPDGHITHVTKGTYRVIKTDTGSVYYRRKQSGTWVKKGGTWSLVKGHISKYNRER